MPTDWLPWPGNWKAITRRALQPQDHGSPREAAAEGGHEDRGTGSDAALRTRLGEGDRDRGRGGVPVPLDVDVDLVVGNAETAAKRMDDSDVRLVGNDEIDVVKGKVGPLERDAARLLHGQDRALEHLAPFLLDVLEPLGARPLRRWHRGTARRTPEHRRLASVALHVRREDPRAVASGAR